MRLEIIGKYDEVLFCNRIQRCFKLGKVIIDKFRAWFRWCINDQYMCLDCANDGKNCQMTGYCLKGNHAVNDLTVYHEYNALFILIAAKVVPSHHFIV